MPNSKKKRTGMFRTLLYIFIGATQKQTYKAAMKLRNASANH